MDKKSNEDKLDLLFKYQKKLQEKMPYDSLKKFDQTNIDLMVIAIITELSELVEETPWKPWKKSSKLNIENAQKELIDLWHFVINLSLLLDITPDKLFTMYITKNIINHRRQKNGY